MSASILNWFKNLFQPRRDSDGPLDAILARYSVSRPIPDAISARIGELREASKAGELDSVDVCELELLRLRDGSTDDLLQAIPQLRREFGASINQPPSTKPLDKSNKEALLAEASFLTMQIKRNQDLQELFVKRKNTILGRVALLLVLAFALSLLVVSPPGFLAFLGRDPTIFVVMIVGGCGGFVSFCRRIYLMDPGSNLVMACRLLRVDRAGLIAKPLLGGAFAMGLYLLFLGKMVTGVLFPTILLGISGSGAPTLKAFFTATVTATDFDFAKLLVWCFIAGFAERFVPDLLDHLSAKSSVKSSESSK